MPAKNNLKDKLEDDVLDLSLMQLSEAPVEEIAQLKKGTTLDLSNNLLTYLPDTFPTLTHLVKLDLSKNMLEELPEYFGQLKSLRHLDLYSNKLEKLPVSFASLKNLKFLDLKNNPLVPALQQAAGPCQTSSDCAMCAKKVVALMQSMQSQLERERQRRILEDRKAKEEQRLAEEQEKERIRAEKRAAKERRRDEARLREEARRKESEAVLSAVQHEMERPRSSGNGIQNGGSRTHAAGSSNGGWCWSLLMMLAGLSIVLFGSAISVIWIYTGGHLDQRSIERALPVIQRDVDATFETVALRSETIWTEANKKFRPLISSAGQRADQLWAELSRRNDLVAHYLNENVGPHFCKLKSSLWQAWQSGKPRLQSLGESIVQTWKDFKAFCEKRLPPFINYVSGQLSTVYEAITKNIQTLLA